MFTELYREEKREEGDRGGQEDKRGESKGERQIQPVNSSLSVLPEKAMALHSSTLAWKIPWMEEPDRLQSMGLQRVRHD